jgi:quinol monooxygenase YgiN
MSNRYAGTQPSVPAPSRTNQVCRQALSSSTIAVTSLKRRNIPYTTTSPPPQDSVRLLFSRTIKYLASSLLIVSIILFLFLATVTNSRGTSSIAHIQTPTTTTKTTASTVTMEQVVVSNHPKPFSLMVKLTFIELQYQEQFIRDITPLCQHIQEHERDTTIAYEVLLSDQDPLQVLILERYMDKENAFLQIHKTSVPFLEFRTKLQTMQTNQYVTIDGASYYDSGIGYIHH